MISRHKADNMWKLMFFSINVALLNNIKHSITALIHSISEMFSLYLLRHILAICHFNENLSRETMKTDDRQDILGVSFPKYKL